VIGLAVNLALLLALLALFQATLTLPGIAGIILTIGMSVDANILIFERIREELKKGKTLVSSAQSGFDRAFVTIVDANLTTILTGIILYKFGVGPIKGFAVTLIAGIACSMFAALFLSRTLFATAIKYGWVKDTLKMSSVFKPDGKFDFLSKSTFWIRASLLALVVSLGIFFATGTNKYGLDFTGGTVVRLNLTQVMPEVEVKSRITKLQNDKGAKYPAVEVTRLSDSMVVDGTSYTTYDVHLQSASGATPKEITDVVTKSLKAALAEKLQSSSEAKPTDKPGTWIVDFVLTEDHEVAQIDTLLTGYSDERGVSPFQTAIITGVEIVQLAGESDQLSDHASKFQLEINEKNLMGYEEVLKDLVQAFKVELPVGADGAVNYKLGFPKLDYVGPNVVADLKQQAIIAIVLSLIALILYIWIRFKDLKFGLAASAALFHDVIVALGIVVGLNLLGLVHVPLNLPIIAGFLTLIGYSLNDTIILFDRVRENLGNVKGTYRDVINLSINQTLGRTILTSATTLVVVLVLFVFNYGAESPLEGIAFTLSVGIIVGTYSSIFIASPLLIWMHNREVEKLQTGKSKS
jgi:SecD/SecF fusion protein